MPAMVGVQAAACAPQESRHYFAQMQAYRTIPDERLLTVTDVRLMTPIEEIVSRPGIRTNCDICGEEIINEREVEREGLILCRACAGMAYYRHSMPLSPAQQFYGRIKQPADN